MSHSIRTIPYEKNHSQPVRLTIGIALFLGFGLSGVAATWCVNQHGTSGCKSTISAAVAAAAQGDTIVVARGTYKEQVIITKSLSLIALNNSQPTIDATGLSNGVFINGMHAAPNAGVANVLISGFTIHNANFEGILIVNAYDVTITGNHVLDNNKSLAGKTCPGIPAFETSEGEDCGEGIHLMAATHSSVVGNEIEYNSGGILISDETGSSRDNLISGNLVHDNPYDCGITMASHGPATSVIPSARVSFGLFHNTISHNVSSHNGYRVPGAGAGVGIFAPFPGATAAANVVIDNELLDNGLPGVAMHNHAAAPAPAPPVDLDDNVIVGNHFSGNAADTADAATSGPTGINIYSVAPINGTVISQNVFNDEAIDVAFKAPSGHLSVHFNDFDTNGIGVDNLGAGFVNATDNWWHCPAGPGGRGCTTAAGSGLYVTPWLTAPFEADTR